MEVKYGIYNNILRNNINYGLSADGSASENNIFTINI